MVAGGMRVASHLETVSQYADHYATRMVHTRRAARVMSPQSAIHSQSRIYNEVT